MAIDAEWMIDSIDSISPTISKEWIALILLPTVGSLAGTSTSFKLPAAFDGHIRVHHRHKCICQGQTFPQYQRCRRLDYRT